MKITSTALFLIAVGALGASEAARDGSLTRRRTLEQSNDDAAAVRIIPANEEDEARAGQDEPFPIMGKKSKSNKGQVANTPTAIITNFRKKCYYLFDDEDEYELIPGADSGMTCANNVCNVDFVGDRKVTIDNQDGTANRIIGLKLTPTSKPGEIAGKFFVGCAATGDKSDETWKAAFTCPSGYYVKEFRTFERKGGSTPKVTEYSGCSTNVGPGKQDYRRQVCTEFLKNGIPDNPNYFYTLTCKEIAVPV